MKNNGKKMALAPTVIPSRDAISRNEQRHPAAPRPTGQQFRPLALAGLTVALLALCVLLALPFLPALTWGITFAIIAAPLHIWIRRRIANAKVAALAATVVVLLVIVVPGLIVVSEIVSEATSAAERMKSDAAGASVRARMAQIPFLHGVQRRIDSANIDIDAEIRRGMMSAIGEPARLLQGSLAAMIQFAIALFILFHILKDGPNLCEQARCLLPMSRSDSERVFVGVADSVHANVYATLITSLIDAVTGGVLFWALGLPSPVFLGAVIFVVTILPIFGSFVIWIPAAIYLLAINQFVSAAVVTTWGFLATVLVDNLLFFRLAGKRMRLHQVPFMLSLLGGLALFGPSGIILGPAIVAATVAMFEVWRRRPDPTDTPHPLSPAIA